MMNPFPNVIVVHSLLIHEERHREISSSPNVVTEATSMHVNSNFKTNLSCSQCKKIGHTKANCYRLN